MRYLDWGPNTLQDTAQFLAAVRAARQAAPRTIYHLAIVLRFQGGPIGGCRIEIRSTASGSGDLGYVLERSHWGYGYATEAIRVLVDFGFGHLALLGSGPPTTSTTTPRRGSSRSSACGRKAICGTACVGRASGEIRTSTPSSSRSGGPASRRVTPRRLV